MTRSRRPSEPAAAEPGRPAAIACRRLRENDLPEAAALLTRGFPERDAAYWARGLERLRVRAAPEAYPRYGYTMTADGRLVGVLLLIFSQGADGRILGNVSSWYVEPAYRGYSNALLAFVFRLKDVVLFNISPAPGTIATIEAQGFRRYCAGTFHALAASGRIVPGARLREVAPDAAPGAPRLARLAALGCRSYEIAHDGSTYDFAFLPRRFARDRWIGAQLVDCPDLAAFVRFAGPLGRRLLRHRMATVMLDANGPVPGLRGRYMPGRREKFFRGAAPPPLNALGDTELVLFGP